MGGYTLKALRIAIHGKYLLFRSIDHLVYSSRFEEFFKENPNIAVELVNGQTRYVKKRMDKFYVDNLSYKKLRYLASSLKIINYSRMSKAQLEKAIDKRRDEISDLNKTKRNEVVSD